MDNLLQGMMGNFSDSIIEKVAEQAGVDPKLATMVLEKMAPAMAGSMGKQAQTAEGADVLDKVLTQHDGSVFGNMESMMGGDLQKDGAKILGHVFGSKAGQVGEVLGKETGASQEATSKMMETFAPLILGSLGKQKSESGLDIGALAGMLGGAAMGGTSGKKQSMLMGLLDLDNDGKVIDDVPKLLGYAKIAQKFLGLGRKG